jgi:hypothetical protein
MEPSIKTPSINTKKVDCFGSNNCRSSYFGCSGSGNNS